MTLKQLRYIHEIQRQNLNITAAAERLFTSQPGISKQLKALEEELGVPIFVRTGKHLSGTTPAGDAILAVAERVLNEADNVRRVATDFSAGDSGTLAIATTHTQARYALPDTIASFRRGFPDVALELQQGSPQQIARLAARGEVDFAICTEALEHFEDLVLLPCYHWNRAVLVPPGHPLTHGGPVSIARLAEYPIVTYTFGFTGRSQLDQAFAARGFKPNVVLTAVDADVIKTYVRLGLGIGIVANMAWGAEEDGDLVALDASHLFSDSTTHIAFRRNRFLRGYMYRFIERFAPHLDRKTVESIAALPTAAARADAVASLMKALPRQ